MKSSRSQPRAQGERPAGIPSDSGSVEQAAGNPVSSNAQDRASSRKAEAGEHSRAKQESRADDDSGPGRRSTDKRAPAKHPQGKPVPESFPGR